MQRAAVFILRNILQQSIKIFNEGISKILNRSTNKLWHHKENVPWIGSSAS
jgi:hypothetical protein